LKIGRRGAERESQSEVAGSIPAPVSLRSNSMDKTAKAKPVLTFRTNYEPLTQQEIADIFGVKRQYVQMVEKIALRNLRKELEKQSVAFEDL